jgi:hypothetical protein
MQKITNNHKNESFFDDLFYSITDYSAEEDDNPIENENQSSKSRYINGKRSITPFIKKISKRLNVNNMYEWLNEYEDAFTVEDNIKKIQKKFSRANMPLDTKKDLRDEIVSLFNEIITECPDVLPTKSRYLIETDSNNNFYSDNKKINNQLTYTKEQILKEKNKKIPVKYSNDFEFMFDKEDNIVWTNKTADAYNKFPLSFKLKFDSSNPNFDKIKNIRNLINEANMSNGYVELGTAKEASEFLNGDPHPFPKITDENVKGVKWYIGREQNPTELLINLTIKNKYLTYFKNNIKLQLLYIDNENKKYIFTNKWLDTWYDSSLTFEMASRNVTFNYGIRTKYYSNLYYFKDIYKFLFLLKDKNSSITIHAVNENINLLDNSDYGDFDFKEKDNNLLKDDLDIMAWLLNIEESNNCNINFDISEFMTERYFLKVLYYTSKNMPTKVDKNITYTIPNNYNFEIGKKYHFKVEYDSIDIFGGHFMIPISRTLNFNGEIIAKNDKKITIAFNESWPSNDHVSIKNSLTLDV